MAFAALKQLSAKCGNENLEQKMKQAIVLGLGGGQNYSQEDSRLYQISQQDRSIKRKFVSPFFKMSPRML